MEQIQKPEEVDDITWQHFREEITTIQELARPRNQRAERLAGSVAATHLVTIE